VVVRANAQVAAILLELRQPTHKGIKFNPDLVNIAEILLEFASSAFHGVHLWLGVINTNMIAHLEVRGLDFSLPDSKTTPRAKLWK